MQHEKRARILLQFFWEQRMVGLFLVLAISIFALVFSMYDIKLEAILYASCSVWRQVCCLRGCI